MKNILFAASIVSTAILTACSEKPAEPVPSAAPVETTISFRCESGATVTVKQHSASSIAVTYQGKTQEMQSAIAASGSRYLGGDWVWWSKGSGSGAEATLYRAENGETGESIEVCAQQ